MTTHEIRSIGIASLLRIGAVLGALYGALFGVPLALLSLVAESGFGFAGAIGIIVISAISVAISIAISGVAYNVLSSLAGGGITIDLVSTGGPQNTDRRR